MARFYSTFDNSTNAGLEGNRYERKTFTGDGVVLRQNLIDERAALSAAIYAQLDAANRNGTLGRVFPQGSFTLDGTNLSWTNIFTNGAAVWPSDPSIRPTAPITTGNSTPVSPSDGGAVAQSLYTAATAALGAVLAAIDGGGPNGRLGRNAWRTLASLYHDHALTFFAWDDFTPGTPQNFVNGPNVVTGNSGTPASVDMGFGWGWEFEGDKLATIRIQGTISNGTFSLPFSEVFNALPGGATITVTGITAGGIYTIAGEARFFDQGNVNFPGAPVNFSFPSAFTVVEA